MFTKISLACGAAVIATGIALSTAAIALAGQQISVNGTGGAAVPDSASTVQQQTAYNQALGLAISDAQAKAHLVAAQLSLTLGPVESFTEESDDYLGYCGVGFLPTAAVTKGADSPTAVSSPSGQLTPIPAKHKHHKRKSKAHAAATSEDSCEVQADVTVVYAAS
jgi:uncharacterized protein YggE